METLAILILSTVIILTYLFRDQGYSPAKDVREATELYIKQRNEEKKYIVTRNTRKNKGSMYIDKDTRNRTKLY